MLSEQLVGKKVFIKRGEHQAKIALVVRQVDEEKYVLRIAPNQPDWECDKECFVLMRRYRRAYGY
ncbi:DUF3912 family protein [Bowmanella sp. JS7-9]|uniref:DUF3912 family protein n=1 Tax=Pseudobowmanella zhangzhouensis TaxID=1537679 RepID=A0ABW1XIN5_9ALTE|nr:DUF3912 family protein [Bowmanella sp. JS7-9]TBX27321.1 hypothetical protein TK45_00790 [Bowmanella sp. JS7-9]